jgi:hypothetical protein
MFSSSAISETEKNAYGIIITCFICISTFISATEIVHYKLFRTTNPMVDTIEIQADAAVFHKETATSTTTAQPKWTGVNFANRYF